MSVERVPVGDGVALEVHRWDGGGVPFLLVHGLASNRRVWDGMAAALAGRGHPVVAVDLRGHGRSDKPASGYDLATVTGDLVELIGGLGLDRPVATGQSWGGNLVIELGWRRPDLVRGLACVDGGWIELRRRFADWETCRRASMPPATAGRPASEIEAALRDRHPDWPESGIRGTMACFEHLEDGTVRPWLTLGRHLAILAALWEHQPSARYAEVDVPVLLVPADTGDDGHRRRHQVEAAAAGLARSRVHWVAGDHDLHAQHPDRLAGLLHAATEDGFFDVEAGVSG